MFIFAVLYNRHINKQNIIEPLNDENANYNNL